ncbi:MAG: hypothetical protein AAFX05_12845 [Planctomycetota bacterium]
MTIQTLGQLERDCLLLALRRLERGNSNGFDHALWLGFGADWKHVRDQMVQAGYLARQGEAVAATDHGLRLRDSLIGSVAA